MGISFETLPSSELSEEFRERLYLFLTESFGSRFSETDFEHAFGGIHVLGHLDGEIVAHAAAVPRLVQINDSPWIEIAYVEAVAVATNMRKFGVGRGVMKHLQLEIDKRWHFSMLSTGKSTDFYLKLGWSKWQGLSKTQTGGASHLDEEHGGLMFRGEFQNFDKTIGSIVTCQARPGDAW